MNLFMSRLYPAHADLFEFDAAFPRAKAYRSDGRAAGLVREACTAARSNETFSERHLQCIWFDPSLRPQNLKTAEGESVRVVQPGSWNLEAGPDFLRAAVEVGGSRLIEGDAEVHIRPADWNRHGHQNDPRYRHVRIHITFYGSGKAMLPPGCIEIPMQKSLQSNASFSFQQIDLAAYPYAARGKLTACAAVLSGLPPEAGAALLDAAGEERLRRKTAWFAHLLSTCEPEDVLYRELMGALGYKHNSAAFRTLADHVPLPRLREAAGGRAHAAYAILLGCAGLLPKELPARSPECRDFVRKIWDVWWKVNSQWADSIMPGAAWKLSGLRPANHPVRRLMAAAHLFTREEPLSQRLRRAAGTIDDMRELLNFPSGNFWDYYLSFNGQRQAAPVALIGDSRTAAIIINIFIPWLAARGELPVPAAGMLDSLPGGTADSTVKMTAHNLFGPAHSRKLYSSGLRRQGLIQIFNDFCVQDRSSCADCRFPEIIRQNFAVSRSL